MFLNAKLAILLWRALRPPLCWQAPRRRSWQMDPPLITSVIGGAKTCAPSTVSFASYIVSCNGITCTLPGTYR